MLLLEEADSTRLRSSSDLEFHSIFFNRVINNIYYNTCVYLKLSTFRSILVSRFECAQ